MDGRQGFKSSDIRSHHDQEAPLMPRVLSTQWKDRGRTLTYEFARLAPDTQYELPFRGTRFRDAFGKPLQAFNIEFRSTPSSALRPIA
jgi:hypothetical protein